MLSTSEEEQNRSLKAGEERKRKKEKTRKNKSWLFTERVFCLFWVNSSSTATPFSQLRELVEYRLRTHLVAGPINPVSKAYGLEYNLGFTTWTVTQ